MLLYSFGLLGLFLCFYIYQRFNTIHFIASLFYIYSFTSIYISVLYLDINNVFSPELSKYIGGKSFSSITLLIYFLLFFLASKIVFTKSKVNKIFLLLEEYSTYRYKLYGFDFFTLLSLLLLVFLFLIFLHLFTTPIPIFSGLDRVTYFRVYSGILLTIMIKLINIIALLLGILYVYSKNNLFNRKIVIIDFFLVLVILFMIGNKFSTPFRFILFFLLPLAILYKNNSIFKNIKLKTILFLFIGIIFFFIIIFINIHIYFGDRSLLGYLVERLLILQGQLWWYFYDQYFYFNWSINSFFNAYDNTFIQPLYGFQGNKFLLYLMNQVVEPHQLFNRMDNGYLYTGAYPAFLVVLLSPLGSLLVHFLLALVYSYVLYIFFIFMAKKYFFTSIMLGYLIISLIFIFVTSDFGHLYVYIAKILLIFMAYIIDKLLREGK